MGHTLDDIIAKYQKQQLSVIESVMMQIMSLFDRGATKAAVLATRRRLVNNRFLPKDVRSSIDRIVSVVNADVEKVLINGIKKAWQISNLKSDEIVRTQEAGSGRKPPRSPKVAGATAPMDDMFNHNYSAREAFIKRKDTGGKNAGLNLSKRVHKLSNSYKKAINETLVEGIKEGKPAREIAKSLRKNLRNNTVVENPGQGVYSSPQKNALRLARNEINIAYANAEYERWQQLWFIIGIEIRLSNRHPIYDMCDNLKGRYPKDFHFSGWHVNCLCTALPILAPQEVRDAMMDYQLGLTDKPPKVTYIKALPTASKAWMKQNAERIKGWNSKPYWIQNNSSFVSDLLHV